MTTLVRSAVTVAWSRLTGPSWASGALLRLRSGVRGYLPVASATRDPVRLDVAATQTTRPVRLLEMR